MANKFIVWDGKQILRPKGVVQRGNRFVAQFQNIHIISSHSPIEASEWYERAVRDHAVGKPIQRVLERRANISERQTHIPKETKIPMWQCRQCGKKFYDDAMPKVCNTVDCGSRAFNPM